MKAIALMTGLLLAGSAWAQDAAQDPLKEYKLGDRVELTLKSNFAIQGKLISTTADLTELEKMTVITLDISTEYASLSGHMGVERHQIKSVRRLPRLSPAELEARDKARQQALKRLALEDSVKRKRLAEQELEDEALKAEEEKRGKEKEREGVAGELKAQAEMLEKGAALYAKFPPPEWGAEKLKEISNKSITKVPVLPDETEFVAGYDLWLGYKMHMDKKTLEDKTKSATEEPKKTEPAPAPK